MFAAFAFGTLVVFYLVWAAMHDIAHAEADTTLEYAALAVSVPAFVWLYRSALRRLPVRAKATWLGGTGLLILLFDIAAIQVTQQPKYPADPMLASVWLAAGVPALAVTGYHLARAGFRLSPG